MGQIADRPPEGMVRFTLEVEVPVEAIVQTWTKAQAEALLAGEQEGRYELIAEASGRPHLWSNFVVADYEIDLKGERSQ